MVISMSHSSPLTARILSVVQAIQPLLGSSGMVESWSEGVD